MDIDSLRAVITNRDHNLWRAKVLAWALCLATCFLTACAEQLKAPFGLFTFAPVGLLCTLVYLAATSLRP